MLLIDAVPPRDDNKNRKMLDPLSMVEIGRLAEINVPSRSGGDAKPAISVGIVVGGLQLQIPGFKVQILLLGLIQRLLEKQGYGGLVV